MKVALLSTNSHLGGAAVVTLRLAEALQRQGVEARVVAANVNEAHPLVVPAGPTSRLKAAFLAEHAEIFAANSLRRAEVFKASTGRYGLSLLNHPAILEADAVMLNWVNQGMISLGEIERIAATGKRIIWTMHDMWNCTSLCHHAGECGGFRQNCQKCPLVHSNPLGNLLSRSVHKRKRQLYGRSNITFVAVSSWLAGRCRESSLMSGADIRVIPNALEVENYAVAPTLSRRKLGLPEKGKIILMGAARLDDPIKGLETAVDAFNNLKTPDAVAVLFGELRNPRALEGLNLPHRLLGPVADQQRLRQIYAHASAVLSSSAYETLPTTLIEGLAAGATAVGFGGDGRDDIILPGISGFLAADHTAASLSEALDLSLQHGFSRRALHEFAASRFSSQAVARKYLDLL